MASRRTKVMPVNQGAQVAILALRAFKAPENEQARLPARGLSFRRPTVLTVGPLASKSQHYALEFIEPWRDPEGLLPFTAVV